MSHVSDLTSGNNAASASGCTIRSVLARASPPTVSARAGAVISKKKVRQNTEKPTVPAAAIRLGGIRVIFIRDMAPLYVRE
jgi:hypothetical protein